MMNLLHALARIRTRTHTCKPQHPSTHAHTKSHTRKWTRVRCTTSGWWHQQHPGHCSKMITHNNTRRVHWYTGCAMCSRLRSRLRVSSAHVGAARTCRRVCAGCTGGQRTLHSRHNRRELHTQVSARRPLSICMPVPHLARVIATVCAARRTAATASAQASRRANVAIGYLRGVGRSGERRGHADAIAARVATRAAGTAATSAAASAAATHTVAASLCSRSGRRRRCKPPRVHFRHSAAASSHATARTERQAGHDAGGGGRRRYHFQPAR